MHSFPVYILELGDETRIVFPDDRSDIGHTEFWEATVSHVIAAHFKIPQAKLANLPYCQRRARAAEGNKVYFGGKPEPGLLQLIRQDVGDQRLAFCHDGHEKRLQGDVLAFRKLVRRYSSA